MAKIWPVYDGTTPTRGEPWAHLPLSEAVKLFELRQSDFVSDLETTPRFGTQDRDLWFAGFKHIVVETDPQDLQQSGWKPGFYRSRIKPKEGFARLLRYALTPKLGAENVMRVDWEPTTDSQGKAALRIVVIVTPEAGRRLTGAAVLDASIALRTTLPNVFGEQVPIVEYVTEAELRQRASA